MAGPYRYNPRNIQVGGSRAPSRGGGGASKYPGTYSRAGGLKVDPKFQPKNIGKVVKTKGKTKVIGRAPQTAMTRDRGARGDVSIRRRKMPGMAKPRAKDVKTRRGGRRTHFLGEN